MILSSGVLLYGIAVDDAHHFKDLGNPNLAGPGRGWVVVRAATLAPRAMLAAMERGDFYASTGVELSDYQATATSMTVTVKKTTFAKYRIQFIGKGGAVLEGSARQPRHLHVPRNGRLRARARAREQRPHRLVPAGRDPGEVTRQRRGPKPSG